MTVLRLHPMNLLQSFTTVSEPRRAVATPAWQPAVDIYEEADRYVVRADVPGLDPQEIELRMEDNLLSIKGLRKDTTTDQKSVFVRRELPSGEFERSFRLPQDADAERISAQGKNGVLEILIPKSEQSKPRTIKVNG